jgi:hypothetical protein
MLAVNSTSHSHKSGHYATLLRQLVSLKQHSKDALAQALLYPNSPRSQQQPPLRTFIGQLNAFFVNVGKN